MRGSAAFRTAIAPGGVLAGPWVKNTLWRTARAVPSLDLQFADNKSLADAVTGQSLVTFTRASSGTYVDSTGTLRTAVTNLLLRSEEFNDASWAKLAASISINAIASPFGPITADKLVVDNGQSAGYASQSTSFVSGRTYTASCYAKAGEVSDFRFVFESAAFGSNLNAVFNLSAGIVTSFTAASASIELIGNNWYRCVATATATTTASASAQFRSVHAGNGTNGIYLWGAQLEQSSTVGEYIPTTSTINSAPRFDHDPTTLESLGLLVEEQRTNLLLYSERFDDAWWPKTRSSVTANATAAPDGSITADKLVEDSTASATHRFDSSSVSFPSGTATLSLFAKSNERSRLALQWDGTVSGAASSASCTFDLNAGTTGTPAATVNISSPVASIVRHANGWHRIILTATASASFTGTVRVNLLDASGNISYTGDGSSGLYVWGAQLEAGASPTSYIPTTTAAATRSADVASISESNFSGWYNATQGTIFAGWSYPVTPSSFPRIWQFTEGAAGNNNNFSVSTNFVNHNRFGARAQNVALFDSQQGPDATINTLMRSAMALQSGSIAYVGNGATPTNNAGSMPSGIDRCYIGSSNNSLYLTGHIRRLTYFPQRLPNSTLQALTQ